ncbi:hypothetical protein IGS73_10530 [Janibacter indicus]|uniref:Uncharacterized protein n=1 Tax=Janibacter indicus TaxID=857417 RepID=A0A7L9IWW3_9MICO|nr:hypothetical protein [Janibacter indicus]QOK21594.1 hypothetical protein IGS73_10530 [Janibacter indicus]
MSAPSSDDGQDINAVVQAFRDDPENAETFTRVLAGAERERAFKTDGNVFLALPTDPRSGAGAGADHPVPAFLEPREEMAVDELAARRLISWPALLDACRWARTLEELAEELWMDEATAECRMRHLHMSENAKLMEVWADDARAHGH